MDEIHKGDVGTVLTATIYDGTSTVDLSAATGANDKLFILVDPVGNVSTLTASFVGGSGTSGVVGFTTTASTLNTIGTWRIQAWVTLGSNLFHSSIYNFVVHANLA